MEVMKKTRRSRDRNNTGSKELRTITPKPRMTLTGHGGAEHAEKGHHETRSTPRRFEGPQQKIRGRPNWGAETEQRGTRSRPKRAYGTNVKSEGAHINAEEMLDAAEVHYTCFGEFLSLLHLLNRLNEQRRPKILYVAPILLFFVLPEPVVMKIFEILNGCLTYLICELGEFFCFGEPRRSMTRPRWPSTANGCAEEGYKLNQTTDQSLESKKIT